MPKHGKARKSFAIYTQDRLLLNYPGAIGVKTGWTTKARGTFVGAATRNGHTLVATVLHTKFASWEESRALLAWGFANLDKARPVGSLNQIKHATQASTVRPSGAVAKTNREVAIGAITGPCLPLWAWVPIALLVAVVALRTRRTAVPASDASSSPATAPRLLSGRSGGDVPLKAAPTDRAERAGGRYRDGPARPAKRGPGTAAPWLPRRRRTSAAGSPG